MISAAAGALLPVATVTAPAEGEAADAATGQPFVAVLAAALAAPAAPPLAAPLPAAPVVVSDADPDATEGESALPVPTPSPTGEQGDPAAAMPTHAGAARAEAASHARVAVSGVNLIADGAAASESQPTTASEAEREAVEASDVEDAAPSPMLPQHRGEATSAVTGIAASAEAPTMAPARATERGRPEAAPSPSSPRGAPDVAAPSSSHAATSTLPPGTGAAAARSTAAGVLAALSETNGALRDAAGHVASRSILAGLATSPSEAAVASGDAAVPMPEGVTVVVGANDDAVAPTASAPPPGLRGEAPALDQATAPLPAVTPPPMRRAEVVARVTTTGAAEAPERAGEREARPVASEAPVEGASPPPRLPWAPSETVTADAIPDAAPPRAMPERTPTRVVAPAPSFVTVELDPETSGAQRVRVAVRGDAVHATVVTDASGVDALRPQLGELRQALEGQGFREATVQLRTSGDGAVAAPVATGQELRARGESGPASDGTPGDPHARGRQRGQDHQSPGQGRQADPEEEMA